MDIRVQMPPSKAGVKLLKSNALSSDFYVLYKKASKDDDRYSFAGLYNPANEYNEDYIAVPFSSSYDGTVAWAAGTIFSNVIGSSDDSSRVYYNNVLYSWKTLSRQLGIQWHCLAERDHFYDLDTLAVYVPVGSSEIEKYSCNDLDSQNNIVEPNIVGGHVILCNHPREMQKNSDDVYIVPICKHHNTVNLPHKNSANRNTTPRNGNGFFMKLEIGTNVIKLKGYLKPTEK